MALTSRGLTDSRLQRQLLLDTYGALLTQRQREALRLQLEEDWSISELAASMGASRAAAHDLVRRGLQRLEEVERQLGLCRQLAAAEHRQLELEHEVDRLLQELSRLGARA
jgi:predicted DNA-binding protein YlxM (UPF0122 family)